MAGAVGVARDLAGQGRLGRRQVLDELRLADRVALDLLSDHRASCRVGRGRTHTARRAAGDFRASPPSLVGSENSGADVAQAGRGGVRVHLQLPYCPSATLSDSLSNWT